MHMEHFKVVKSLMSFAGMTDLLMLAEYIGAEHPVFNLGEVAVLKWCDVSPDGSPMDIYSVLEVSPKTMVDLANLGDMELLYDNTPLFRLERTGAHIYLSDPDGNLKEITFDQFEQYASVLHVLEIG